MSARPLSPVVLCILDGVGLGDGGEDDAVRQAHTPWLDRLMAAHPWRTLRAHGTAVGLPSDADMGNSEVGHNAMGAGRVFEQGASLVESALADGRIWRSELWHRLCGGHTLHLLGLVSDGNVHSHVDHLVALIEAAARGGVQRLRVHVLTDGRDVEPRSALTWVEPLEARLAEHRGAGRDYRIASGGGRMQLTMDRYEADWGMVERGWRCHVHGEGRPFTSASEAIQAYYREDPGLDDQHLPAFVVVDDQGEPVGRIVDGDAVLLFNFRGDRAVEITRAFEDDTFDAFDRGDRPEVTFAGMMQYDGDLHLPHAYLVEPPRIDRTVGQLLAQAGRRTFACAETQKFGHVTYFFNGNRSGLIDASLEHYLQIDSDSRPLQQRPWMKAAEVTDAVVEAITSGSYDHVRLNLANGDMIGHTGDLDATRIAIEAVDLSVGRLWRATQRAGGILLITADHGNADQMYLHDRRTGALLRTPEGAPLPCTSHTLSPVPFVVCDPRGECTLRTVGDAGIASIGATVLELCGVQPPADYLPGLIAS